MSLLRVLLLPAVVLAMLLGCESGEPTAAVSDEEDADEEGATSQAYEVVLGNAITDTLRGSAGFGLVEDRITGKDHFVIRLATAFDFAGGIVMARPDTALPQPGEYGLRAAADTAAAGDDRFVFFYREGMVRHLEATAGTLTLSTVTDSLIVGRFDATLRGTAAGRNRPSDVVDVHAVGRFRADPGLDGYIIGL